MNIPFHIVDWAAYAVDLHTKTAWLDWAANPRFLVGNDVPALLEVTAIHRRRLEKIGRTALQVAYWCQSAEADDIPLVFASRHGDMPRTYALLDAMARNEAMSPTHFGLSIHNAVVAQYSIARGLRNNYLAVAAGKSTAEAAVLEALGLLQDGAEEVLVVMYDGQLPEVYLEFLDEPPVSYAWAWRIKKANISKPSFSLCVADGSGKGIETQTDLPHGLDVLRFMLSNDSDLLFSDGKRRWCWKRHV